MLPLSLLLLLTAADAPVSRVVFGSCADQNKPCPVWDKMADAKPDVTVLLGDNVYADLVDGKLVPAKPGKIAQSYEQLAAVPGFQRLRKAAPILAVWDDHDYGKNDAGADWENRQDAQKLLLDFFGVPADSPRRQREGVYHSETFGPPGKRVQIILLDTRYHRSPLTTGPAQRFPGYDRPISKPYQPDTDPKKTFLGDAQWKWLEEQLRQPADVRLIGSGIQVVSEDHPFEKWANLPAERNRLYKLIRDTQATGVVVLSGDRHLGELSLDPTAAGYPLYDLTSSGINQGAKAWRRAEPNARRVAAMPYGDNFGVVGIDWQAGPTVTLELRDDQGQPVVRHPVPLGVLKPTAAGAEKPADPAPAAAMPAGVISAADARTKVGEAVTVQFVVKAGRGTAARILLNSESDFRSPANFTVVLNKAGQTGKWADATLDTFKGKTIRATGTVTLFQERPQIQIDAAGKLEVVGDN
jgi:alkaline phosphatase D